MLRSNPNSDEWLDLVNEILPKYKIDTPERIAAFFAQTAYESADFTLLIENMNYSAEGLERVFSRYFSKSNINADHFARQPEKIANYVYGGRMGNGGPQTGDGWRYRGRGIIQLTGKENYRMFAEGVGMQLSEVTAYLETKKGALESACWFWSSKGLNNYADRGAIETISKRVNGGTNGMAERKKRFRKFLSVVGDIDTYMPCQKGDEGHHVMAVQRELNVPVDGVFGPTTLAAVKKFQSKNGLTVDGKVGPKTLKAIFGEK